MDLYFHLLTGVCTNELQHLCLVQTRNYLSLEQLPFTVLRIDS